MLIEKSQIKKVLDVKKVSGIIYDNANFLCDGYIILGHMGTWATEAGVCDIFGNDCNKTFLETKKIAMTIPEKQVLLYEKTDLILEKNGILLRLYYNETEKITKAVNDKYVKILDLGDLFSDTSTVSLMRDCVDKKDLVVGVMPRILDFEHVNLGALHI